MSRAATEIGGLLERLADDPEQTDDYLVLADALSEQGDPRGALITVQHRLGEQPDDEALRRQEAALLGQLALPPAELQWHLGFIRRADIDLAEQPAKQLRALLDHPCAALITELRVRAAYNEITTPNDQESNVHAAIEILGERSRPALRKLTLFQKAGPSAFDGLVRYAGCEHRETRLWTRLPRLERLHLGGVDLFHAIEHPRLEVLVLDDLPLCPYGSWSLPALRSLDWSLYWETINNPTDCQFDNIDVWWRALPALRDLTLRGSFYGDVPPSLDRPEILRLVRQLDRLALPEDAIVPVSSAPSDIELDDYLITRAEHLRHLSRLLISCEPEILDVEAIRAALPNVELVETATRDRAAFTLDDPMTSDRR